MYEGELKKVKTLFNSQIQIVKELKLTCLVKF